MTMKAGRDLDILIAEKVMGLIRTEYLGRFHWSKYEKDWASFVIEVRDYDKNRTQGDPQPEPLPKYSVNLRDARQVIEKMRELGCSYVFNTDPLAICLAALKFVGYEA